MSDEKPVRIVPDAVVTSGHHGAYDAAIRERAFDLYATIGCLDAERTERLLRAEAIMEAGDELPAPVPSARTIRTWAKSGDWELLGLRRTGDGAPMDRVRLEKMRHEADLLAQAALNDAMLFGDFQTRVKAAEVHIKSRRIDANATGERTLDVTGLRRAIGDGPAEEKATSTLQGLRDMRDEQQATKGRFRR